MTSAQIIRVFDDAIRAAIPESSLTLSEWADTYRHLSPERSARPGKWRTDVVPHLRVPMNLVTRADVREFIFVKSSQVAGTDGIANNAVGFYIHIDPSPILYVAEDESKAKAWSQEYLAPMIRDTPVLSALVADAKSRDSGNTVGAKSFPGGHLAVGWATSPATGSSRPRRIVILDERDAFKPTPEGDYVTIVEARTKTFEDTYKLLKISSPRNRLPPPPGSPPDAPHLSPIEREYETADYKGQYFVPCPQCGDFQVLTWKDTKGDYNLRLDPTDPTKAFYVCVNGCVIEQEDKAEMLARGEWRFEDQAGNVYSETEIENLHMPIVAVRIWEAYSPFVSWGRLVNTFLRKKDNVEELKSFVNTSLAEGWEDSVTPAEIADLTDRREEYDLIVPMGVLLVTAGVDVQKDRLEVEITGWGMDEESWSIDYRVLEGDPSLWDVWLRLEEYLQQEFACEWGGTLRVAAAAIDTGGHHTHQVYRFCHKNRGRRYYAIKGANTPGHPLAPMKPSLKGRPPVPLYLIGTETAKDTLSNHLSLKEPGPGYCHFPQEREGEDGRIYYGEEHFKQLRSERAKLRGNVRVWEKIKQGIRNEALDTRVYSMAARAILKPNFIQLQKRFLRSLQAAQEETPAEDTQAPASSQPRRPPSFVNRFSPGRFSGGFAKNWR